MSSKRVKGEKLTLIFSITGVFHFSLDKYISSQKTDLCPHIDAIYDFTNMKIKWAAINFHLIAFAFRARKEIELLSLMHGVIRTGNDDPVTR